MGESGDRPVSTAVRGAGQVGSRGSRGLRAQGQGGALDRRVDTLGP